LLAGLSFAVITSKEYKNMSLKPNLDGKSTMDKVEEVSKYLLGNFQPSARSNETAQFGNVVFDEAEKVFPDEGFAKNTFLQYLSVISKKESSPINCLGKRQGYYLAEEAQKILEESQQTLREDDEPERPPTASTQQHKEVGKSQKELLLYPALTEWLMERKYRAKDISNGRSLGKWGNPDVAGIKSIDIFNGISIEVVTIEAKVTKDGWEQLIFEAISHRRFANRSYFAFAHPSELFDKLPLDEMRYYAELFQVGILVLQLSNDIFNKLAKGELDKMDSSMVDIKEVNSAPYQIVQPKYQLDFCKAQGISVLHDLHRWGEELRQDD
jgi:hypothetical protein